jgi:holo-[acyl-carrier protein] synthase
MILKTGIDLIEIPRIQAALDRHGDRFLERVFTPAEIAECRGRAEALAVRFAAKEAAVKALGTDISPMA